MALRASGATLLCLQAHACRALFLREEVSGMESKRKREEPWGAWNLVVNIIRLAVDVVRLFWHNIL